MRVWWLIGAGGLMSLSSPACADATGAWRINGRIEGRTFLLDCVFNGKGGACVDVQSQGKRSLPLTSFSSSDDKVSWSFNTKVALLSIKLNFAGRIADERISGTMQAAGRTGTFSGVRR
jgi:hypothetical protein